MPSNRPITVGCATIGNIPGAGFIPWTRISNSNTPSKTPTRAPKPIEAVPPFDQMSVESQKPFKNAFEDCAIKADQSLKPFLMSVR